MNIGNNSAEQLKSIIERIERLEEEKAATATDIKDVYTEAHGNGFDKKALREIVRRRKMDQEKLSELEAIIEAYTAALGGLADLPLGVSALSRIQTAG